MTNLLWSDPGPDPGYRPSPRGAGVQWGVDKTEQFQERSGLAAIVRGHQLVNGVREDHDG